MKIDYKKLFLLGFGFMGISVVWALYNADVPVILQSQFGMSNFATGWIMNIDNIFAVTLIPIIAAYSDKVSTKIGRRMPFIITGMPLMAVFFALVPWIPLFFGTSTGIRDDYFESTFGNKADTEFGISLSSAGDVNGDQRMDIIVGAPNYRVNEERYGSSMVYYSGILEKVEFNVYLPLIQTGN